MLRGFELVKQLAAGPATLINRWAERSALRRNELDKTLVQRPHRARWLYTRTMVLFVVVLATWAVYVWTGDGDGWAHTLIGVALGGYLGSTALGGMGRAIAYRAGWLDGRSQMVHALAEAQRRGLRPDDWLRGQWEADAAVLGISPNLLPDEGGDL